MHFCIFHASRPPKQTRKARQNRKLTASADTLFTALFLCHFMPLHCCIFHVSLSQGFCLCSSSSVHLLLYTFSYHPAPIILLLSSCSYHPAETGLSQTDLSLTWIKMLQVFSREKCVYCICIMYSIMNSIMDRKCEIFREFRVFKEFERCSTIRKEKTGYGAACKNCFPADAVYIVFILQSCIHLQQFPFLLNNRIPHAHRHYHAVTQLPHHALINAYSSFQPIVPADKLQKLTPDFCLQAETSADRSGSLFRLIINAHLPE